MCRRSHPTPVADDAESKDAAPVRRPLPVVTSVLLLGVAVATLTVTKGPAKAAEPGGSGFGGFAPTTATAPPGGPGSGAGGSAVGITGGLTPEALAALGPVSGAAAASVAGTGNAFDTCAAPSIAEMQAWLTSPYRSIGIYIGGVARGCAQPNLTSTWVRTIVGQGWSLLPLYVGLQAPCYTGRGSKIDPSRAAAQGSAAAIDAISKMAGLGIPSSTPVYFDMENYDPRISSCVAAVKAFTNAWSVMLRQQGHVSGIYGDTSSMAYDLVLWQQSDPSFHQPDELWFAHWNGLASTTGEPAIPDSLWAGHRVHQFAGGHQETYGGVTMNIDSDVTSSALLTPLGPTLLYDSVTAKIGTDWTALKVAGKAGVPTDATGVAVTVTVVGPTAAGASLIVSPYKGTANVGLQQFVKGQIISQTGMVGLHQGNIQFRVTAGSARIKVIVQGYLAPARGSRMTAVGPTLLYDSVTAKIGTHWAALNVAGMAGVPTGATAVAVTVTVLGPTARGGNLIVSPYLAPTAAGLQQFVNGRNVSQTVIVGLHQGHIQFRVTAGSARIKVIVQGYLTASQGSRMTAVGPTRLYDSGTARIGTSWGVIKVAGKAGVPARATAVAITMSVLSPTAGANLLVAPDQGTATSGVQQFLKGQAISQTVIVALRDGDIQFRVTTGTARIQVTVLGYLS
jgi:hypothetical protein